MPTHRLNVITPCSRPYYLPTLATQLRSYSKLITRWFIVLDKAKKPPLSHLDFTGFSDEANLRNILGPNVDLRIAHAPTSNMGNSLRNIALAEIAETDEELVTFLDDDNLLPSDYEDTVVKALADFPCACGYIFTQLNHKGNVRMTTSSDNPRSRTTDHTRGAGGPGREGCDTGQMLFRMSFIGKIRWESGMSADKAFYDAMKNGRESRIEWLNTVGSLYNYLRPKELPLQGE